jgi:hypothetical protein
MLELERQDGLRQGVVEVVSKGGRWAVAARGRAQGRAAWREAVVLLLGQDYRDCKVHRLDDFQMQDETHRAR